MPALARTPPLPVAVLLVLSCPRPDSRPYRFQIHDLVFSRGHGYWCDPDDAQADGKKKKVVLSDNMIIEKCVQPTPIGYVLGPSEPRMRLVQSIYQKERVKCIIKVPPRQATGALLCLFPGRWETRASSVWQTLCMSWPLVVSTLR